MASYGNTVLTSAGIDLVKRVIAKTATFEITRVATSSDSRLVNADISTIEAMTALPSVTQTGKVTAFDKSSDKQVGLKCEFTNQGLTNPYDICGVGIYAKEAGKSEILFAVAPAKEPETMPAKPDDQSALFTFSLNVYMAVGQASAMSITATTEGVVKSINGTIKPDANGNVTLPYYSQAEVDQKVSSLSGRIDSKVSGLQSTVSNMRAGDRNYARDTFNEWKTLTGFTGAGVYYAKHLGSFCPDDLKVGDTVTIGLSIKNSGIQSGTLNIEAAGNLTVWSAGAIFNPRHDIAKVCPDGTTTTLIQYYTLTADNLKNNSFDFQIRANDFLSGTLSYKGLFVKKGTLATDWTPAPEDTDQAISKVSQTADAIRADLTNTKGDVASVKATASSLQQTANGLTSTVSNLHAGDRNLARGGVSSKDWVVFQGFNGSENYCYNLINYYLDTLKAGDVVTFGVTMRNDGVTSGTMRFQQYGDVTIWNRDGGDISPIVTVTDLVPNGTEKALTYTIPITAGMLNSNNCYRLRIRTDGIPAGGKLSFRYAFVKKGTLATDWTPAPEDTDQAISKVSQTANAAKAKADDNANSIKALSDETTKAISNLDSKMTRLMPQAAYVPIQIGDKTDLNDLRTCGFYLLKGQTINSPVDGWNINSPVDGWNYVKVQGIPARLNQFVWQDINPAKQWCRWYDGSKWLPWVECTKATEPIRKAF